MTKYEKAPDFCEWYDLYPRKVGKAAALKAWLRCKDKPSQEELIHKLQQQIHHERQWQGQLQYIPHPATYINQERWDDEITPITTQHQHVQTPQSRNRDATESFRHDGFALGQNDCFVW